jgi:hypothetical protein
MLLGLAVVFLAVTIIQDIKTALVISAVVLIITVDLIGFVFFTSWAFPDHGFVVEVNAISVFLNIYRLLILSHALGYLYNLLLMFAFQCSS